jgi:hypothetical protein
MIPLGPMWDDQTLGNDPKVPEGERVAVAIDRNNKMNTVMKIKKSNIINMPPQYPWGVFVEESIEPDVIIVEYKGELMSKEQRTRSIEMGKHSKSNMYVFDNGNGTFTDGQNPLIAGVARFINATGEGEEEDANVQVCCNNGRLYVESRKYIHPGSELLYDYGKKYEWKDGEQKSCYKRLFARKKPRNHNQKQIDKIKADVTKLTESGDTQEHDAEEWKRRLTHN